jgi:hypothetical protein
MRSGGRWSRRSRLRSSPAFDLGSDAAEDSHKVLVERRGRGVNLSDRSRTVDSRTRRPRRRQDDRSAADQAEPKPPAHTFDELVAALSSAANGSPPQ